MEGLKVKHTPRPWRYEKDGFDANCVIGSDGSVIADLMSHNREANAHLIVSAPELLKACQYALEHAEDYEAQEGVLDLLRRAVYKAEGKIMKLTDGLNEAGKHYLNESLAIKALAQAWTLGSCHRLPDMETLIEWRSIIETIESQEATQ